MVESEVLESMKIRVEAEIQAFAGSNDTKYPYHGFLNNFYGLFIKGHKQSRDQIEGTKWMSPLRQRLYELADQSLALEGIDPQRIKQYLQQSKRGFDSGDDNALMIPLEEMNKMLFPAYVRLRALGFAHHPDLTG